MYEIIDSDLVDEITLHKMGTAAIKDITIAGAKIAGSQLLPKGLKMEITMAPLSATKNITVVGRVVWNKKVSADVFDCGVQFTEYIGDSKMLLEKYVDKLEEDEAS